MGKLPCTFILEGYILDLSTRGESVMGINVVFAGGTVDYIKGLSLFFLKNYSTDYEVIFLENLDSLIRDGMSFYENTFYVLEEDFYKDSESFISRDSSRIIILTDKITSENTSENLCIFKYQNLLNICDKIVDFIDENMQGELVCKVSDRAKLYVFYSPVSSSGNSLISEVFAFLKAGLGRRVLYISLDSFAGIRFAGNSKFTASDFFSSIDSKLGILAVLKKTCASYRGVDYLLPFDYELDKSCLSLELFKDVINYIVEKSDYDYVCLDLNRAYFSYAYGLADICERMVISIGNQEGNEDKYLKFNEEVKRIYKGEYDEKTISIFNKLTRSKLLIDCMYSIGYDEKIFSMSVLDDAVLGTAFVRDIRGIIDG